MWIIIAIVIAVGFGGLMYLGHKSGGNATPAPMRQLAAGTTVYDVRTPGEYAAGHVRGATLLPLQGIQAGKLPAVAKDAPIAVYCRSGGRSGQATAILTQAGHTNIVDIGGLTSTASYGLAMN